MNYEVEILKAQEFACENFNISRVDFVELAADRYPSMKDDARLFLHAVKAYDEIQKDMQETEYLKNVMESLSPEIVAQAYEAYMQDKKEIV